MSRSYYVIELSARWLTILLVALALLMVLAFGLGYGAAWSTLDGGRPAGDPVPASTPIVETEVIQEPTTLVPLRSPTPPVAPVTPQPAPPTAAPPTEMPATPTPEPPATATPAAGFWVQVLASSTPTTVEEARMKLVELGFDREHQVVVRADGADGKDLVKLRVGPFPDRRSADRVLERMRSAGFADAWVVVP